MVDNTHELQRIFAQIIRESECMDIAEDQNSDINELIEQYLTVNCDSKTGVIKRGSYNDENIQKGSQLLSQIGTEELNLFLVDYTTQLIDNAEVDLDSNDSITEWRRYVYPHLAALWYMVFDVLKVKGLLIRDFESPEAGSAPENLMNYVETIGGYPYKKIRSISNSYKIKLPSKEEIGRYLKSPHRTL